MSSIYQFSVENQQGQQVALDCYKGKVLLLVNTATACGLTPQYQGLQTLYETYREKGFEILDFPSNQFKQAPGSDDDINQFCQLHYATSFPRFAKIKVNGATCHPLYQYLKEQQSGPLGKRIEWNFVKFLIDRQGRAVKRFAATSQAERIAPHIEALLNSD